MIKLILSAILAFAGLNAPFQWSGQTWCPTYQAQYGCDNTQHPSQYSVAFSPAQVTESNGDLNLAMDYPEGLSGAFSSQFYIYPRQWAYARIYLPCVSGEVANWPAFWLNGTTGPWPGHGEIDVAEGLRGNVAWHYHYLNAAGNRSQIGAAVPGNWCGWHTYGVYRGVNVIRIRYDGSLAGLVTASEIGVPLVSDPMEVIFDNGAGSYGGPAVSAKMVVGEFDEG